MRDDGTIYGLGTQHSIADLGFAIKVDDEPPKAKRWHAPSVKRYVNGILPNPTDVFERLIDTVDQFVDFESSLADAKFMQELVSCYIMSTWFLDAYSVVGYLWVNGERGSGKTQLVGLICEVAYLSEFLLAGGSYATLRDCSAYGSTTGFDDAVNISDSKAFDPDKRALILAGNRRGATVTYKEPQEHGKWITTRVATYCARLFSAIGRPDATLASRTIIVPMIRTVNPKKGNANPQDYPTWRHDRRQVIDDLWAIGLKYTVTMRDCNRRVGQLAPLQARRLEPWRGILSVALWLQELGVDGLYDRMVEVAQNYQSQQAELVSSDHSSVVVRAIIQCVADAPPPSTPGHWVLPVEDITSKVAKVCKELDQSAMWVKVRVVGRILSQLRFDQAARAGGKGSRPRIVTLDQLEHWSKAYAIELPSSLQRNGTNGTMAQPPATQPPMESLRI